MKTILFDIKLLEPLLVTGIEGDPNSKVSLDYIPGSVLRGACIGRFSNGKKLEFTESVTRLFFSNSVRFLNAYPVVADQRSIPTPTIFERAKYGDRSTVYTVSLVHTEKEKSDNKAEESEKAKKEAVGGFSVLNTELHLARTERNISVHTTRDRTKGRATEDDGAVFRYDALQAGLTFRGAVRCENGIDTASVMDYLAQVTMLGGSRSAGYGRVEITDVQVLDNWQETDSFQISENRDDGYQVLVLLSDVILRNQWGEYRADLPTLCAALGLEATVSGRASLRTTLHGSFNRTWGKETPQTPAIRMGSYVVVTKEQAVAIKAKVEQGIGERLNDGFGRVMLLAMPNESYDIAPAAKAPTQNKEAVKTLPKHIVERRARLKQASAILECVSEIKVDIGRTSGSQINAIRGLIANQLRTGEPKLTNFKDDLSKRKAASRKQLEKARVEGKTLLTWLENATLPDNTTERDYLEYMDAVLARLSAQKKGANRG